jgi:hypothetical protein
MILLTVIGTEEEEYMGRKLALVGVAVLCALSVLIWATALSVPLISSPAEGYTVHVLAPHLVDGHQMGPYHHYCKVLAPDPVIQCVIYESTEANARLSQVEFIVAKKLTRNQVSLTDWNANWHDHTIEIASGRVQVLDLPPDKAKEVADLVSTRMA